MQSSNQPGKISLPFANSGAKQPIPVESQVGIEDGRASYVDGFPPLTRTPLAAGGKPPFGTDMNGILFAVTAVQQWQSAGGGFKYDSDFATSIGGYPAGAFLVRSDNAGLWVNYLDGNISDPESGGAGWSPLESGNSTVPMSNSTVTLTSLQSSQGIIIITGALTANVNLVFPAYKKQWLVVNRSTGSFSVTCKTVSGSGVSITSGSTQAVYGDGSDILSSSQTQQQTGVIGLARNVRASVSAANSSATFSADEFVVEQGAALGGLQFRLSSFNKSINLATTGVGGMDIGSPPNNGFVAIYAIYNPSLPTSSTNPGLLGQNASLGWVSEYYSGPGVSGYTVSALMSVWPTNASGQFSIGMQLNRTVSTTPITVLNIGGAASYTTFSIASAVPANAKSFDGYMLANGSSSTATFMAASASGLAEKSVGGYTGTGSIGPTAPFKDHPILTQQSAWYYTVAGSLGVKSTGYTF